MKYLIILLLFNFGICNVHGQSVGINNDGSSPHPSAILDLKSTDQGFLMPRLSVSKLPLNPAEGLMTYITNGVNPGLKIYENGDWRSIIVEKNNQAIWQKSTGLAYYNGPVAVGEAQISSATFTVFEQPDTPVFKIVADGNYTKLLLDEHLQLLPFGGNVSIGYPFDNPVSRLQVNPIGSLNNNGSIDLTQSGFMVGSTDFGILMDANQIEGLGSTTFLNLNSSENLSLGAGGGHVGVGVQNPTIKLDIVDDTWQIKLHNDVENNDNSWYLGSTSSQWTAGDGKLLISPTTASNDAMLALDEEGFTGIGTAFPENRLHVEGGSDLNLLGGGFLQLGGSSSLNIVMDNNEISARDNGNASKLILNKDGGIIEIGDVSSASAKMNVNSSAGQAPVEFSMDGNTRFKIGSNGGVVLGGDANTQQTREVLIDLGIPSKIRFQRDATDSQTLMIPSVAAECNIGSGGLPFGRVYSQLFYAFNTSSYLTYSDERIKDNIEPMSDALEIMKDLKGVTYEIIGDIYYQGKSERNDEFLRKNQGGFIAQEVEKVLPQLVNTDEESGLKSVAYVGLIPYLVEAVKELDRKNLELENIKRNISEMNEMLTIQKNEIEALKKMFEKVEVK